MDFLKKRVKQYQEKKLAEALSKIKFHLDMKKNLEQQIQKSNGNIDVITTIKKEISSHDEMIDIWRKNTEKIKKELAKIDK